eukprot:TRINITY_DN52486_c0_g1_i1.p1 TRINITY_DN52486_c0_g1~~TRINITY_DN52486_c0_g1_i1.p1  ORF type:complete len:253 (-),score=30.99 TRINITY_DN52486_c0_g1_i1:307-1065(-)
MSLGILRGFGSLPLPTGSQSFGSSATRSGPYSTPSQGSGSWPTSSGLGSMSRGSSGLGSVSMGSRLFQTGVSGHGGQADGEGLPGTAVDEAFIAALAHERLGAVRLFRAPITGLSAKLHLIVILECSVSPIHPEIRGIQLEYFAGNNGTRWTRKDAPLTVTRSGAEFVGRCDVQGPYLGERVAMALREWLASAEGYNTRTRNCIHFATKVIRAIDVAYQHFREDLDAAQRQADVLHGAAAAAGIGSFMSGSA